MKCALTAIVLYFINLPTCSAMFVVIGAVLSDLFKKIKSKI